MAGEVKRWTPIEGYLWIDDEAGEYVRHDDHVAECQRLREALTRIANGNYEVNAGRIARAALAEPAPASTEKEGDLEDSEDEVPQMSYVHDTSRNCNDC